MKSAKRRFAVGFLLLLATGVACSTLQAKRREDKTVHWKVTALWGGKKVELRETQRAVPPFGGLVVFFEFLRQVGYREAVSKYLPFRLTSPNAIDPVETFAASCSPSWPEGRKLPQAG